jgi:hypothetical protein
LVPDELHPHTLEADMTLLIKAVATASIAFGTGLMAGDCFAQRSPRGCCHATGCSTISSSELQKGTGESYTVTATGEVFIPPDQDGLGGMSPTPGRSYQWSEDGEFHRCGTSGVTQCLLVPRPGA